MNLLFLVDAGPTAALGHLMRSRALIREAEARGLGLCLALRGEADILDRREWPGFKALEILGAEADPAACVRRAADLAREHGCAWAVVDGYPFQLPEAMDLFHQAGARLLMVDDTGVQGLRADLILNPSSEREELYAGSEAQGLLLGPRYALVDEAFDPALRTRAIGPLERVLVTFGGLDRQGWTERVLRALAAVEPSLGQPLEITVVQGPFFGRDIEPVSGTHTVRVLENASSLAPLMAETDLLVTAAGSTTWQACRMGLPMLAVQVVDNQVEVAQTLAGHGAARCLGPGAGDNQLTEELVRLVGPSARDKLSTNAYRGVDGLGCKRILDNLYSARARCAQGETL